MYKKIITKSLKDVFDNYKTIIKALLTPSLLLLLIEYISMEFTNQNEFGISNVVLFLLSLFIDMIILITVHRILILGAESVPAWGIRSYTKREYSFLLKYLGLMSLVVIIIVPIVTIFASGNLVYPVVFILMIFVLILVSRLSLVFPSISIDENMTFVESWRYTSNYKLLTFVTIIIFPFLFSLVVGGIYTLVIMFLAATISSILSILLVLLNVIVTVFLVSALSNTYMYIIYHTEKGIYDENYKAN